MSFCVSNIINHNLVLYIYEEKRHSYVCNLYSNEPDLWVSDSSQMPSDLSKIRQMRGI